VSSVARGAKVEPLDDVEPLLAQLRRRGYRLGVLTNWDDATFEQVHRTFREPFDLFVTAERVRGFKPEVWHFRAFQLLSQVRKDHWIHIASDWEQDIVPAESFGIQHVWLDRHGSGKDPSSETAHRRSLGKGGAHVRTASEAVRAVDWLFQDQAVCAS
jgi:FMN phosphatase YigB (HAD superfamily)